jgi:Uncharacterized conserved protein (COG2071)
VILAVTVRDLLFVSWNVSRDRVASKLPSGLEPELSDGNAVVTLAFARAVGCKLGPLRVPTFSKLTVHSYVTGPDGPGLCLLASRVSRSTFGRKLVGIPFETARVRVRRGLAEAHELHASVRYRTDGSSEPPELESGTVGSHETAYFQSGGLFRLVARHSPISWERATALAPLQCGPVTALGFEVGEPSSLLYADGVVFRAELPPTRAGRR